MAAPPPRLRNGRFLEFSRHKVVDELTGTKRPSSLRCPCVRPLTAASAHPALARDSCSFQWVSTLSSWFLAIGLVAKGHLWAHPESWLCRASGEKGLAGCSWAGMAWRGHTVLRGGWMRGLHSLVPVTATHVIRWTDRALGSAGHSLVAPHVSSVAWGVSCCSVSLHQRRR